MRLLSMFLFVAIFGLEIASAQVGDPKAVPGGTFAMDITGEPNTLNPFTSTDGYAQVIHGMIYDSMVNMNIDTYEYTPGVAKDWTISKDGLSFTFNLREDVKFQDGKPLTAEDVKFTYEAIIDPAFGAVVLRPFYSFITEVIVHNPYKIEFKVSSRYFKNMDFISGMPILPKHLYKNPKGKYNKKVWGSGPYIFDSWDQGKRIVLKRNPNWYGFKLPQYKGQYNFDKIVYRFVSENNVKLEMLKKGTLNYIALRPEMYVKQSSGPEWGKDVFKVKVLNSAPKGFGYVGWNLSSPIFKDIDVRKALSFTLNRKFIEEKFMYNLSQSHPGPWYPDSMYADPSVKTDPFNPTEALSILRKAGWADTDKDGVLDKKIDGVKTDLRFSILTAADETVKILTVFREDAKKIGIDANIKLVEWQSLMKLRAENKFDGIAMAWGGGSVHNDPNQIWHSSSHANGGSNFVGYKNEKVDKWIEEARLIMDNKERVPVMKKIYKQIAEDRPYLFMFGLKYGTYAYTKGVNRPKDTFNYGIGVDYWWLDK